MNQRKEPGQGIVEYALILVLIALVVIVALRLFGITISEMFTDVNGVLGSI